MLSIFLNNMIFTYFLNNWNVLKQFENINLISIIKYIQKIVDNNTYCFKISKLVTNHISTIKGFPYNTNFNIFDKNKNFLPNAFNNMFELEAISEGQEFETTVLFINKAILEALKALLSSTYSSLKKCTSKDFIFINWKFWFIVNNK